MSARCVMSMVLCLSAMSPSLIADEPTGGSDLIAVGAAVGEVPGVDPVADADVGCMELVISQGLRFGFEFGPGLGVEFLGSFGARFACDEITGEFGRRVCAHHPARWAWG